MKATLSFDLTNNDDRLRHLQCVKSQDMVIALHQINEALYKADDIGANHAIRIIQTAMQNLNMEELT
jgi:hypothetical protein